MRISTPAGAIVMTAHPCMGITLRFENRDSIVDLICLPLKGIDVIIGMDWLVDNDVVLHCKKKVATYAMNAESVKTPIVPMLLSTT